MHRGRAGGRALNHIRRNNFLDDRRLTRRTVSEHPRNLVAHFPAAIHCINDHRIISNGSGRQRDAELGAVLPVVARRQLTLGQNVGRSLGAAYEIPHGDEVVCLAVRSNSDIHANGDGAVLAVTFIDIRKMDVCRIELEIRYDGCAAGWKIGTGRRVTTRNQRQSAD